MSWESVREYSEVFRQSLWGTMVAVAGLNPVPCEASTPEDRAPLQRSDVMPEKPVTITVLNADYAALGSPKLRSLLQWEGLVFQIYAINDDPADATVDMRCNLKV